MWWLLFIFQISALAQSIDIQQRPAEFVDIKLVVPDIILDIRYATSHNFVGKPIDGYRAPVCYMTRNAAIALREVQKELIPMGLSLKIYDAYRPQRAVNHFVRWAKNLSDTTMKAEFYPGVDKRLLFTEGYIASRSGHSRGSTVDITIVPLPAAPPATYHQGDSLCDCRVQLAQRFPDNSLDMGTGWDCFDPLSHTVNPNIGGQQRANRLLLKTLMEKHGFRNYEKEWWHFTLINEPFPNTYFDFVVE
jgi:D-alanyl-D-alanine dipeptidase